MDISVIVPFYNGNKYIPALLDMFSKNADNLAQGVSAELLIVNDSPWIQVELDSNRISHSVRVLNYSDNVGIQGARVRGLAEAQGKYVLMLDQDDEIDEMFLAETYSGIQGYDVCVANGYLCRPGGDKLIYLSPKRQSKVCDLFWYIYLENRILSPGHCLLKKESIPQEWLDHPLTKNGADDLTLWVLMLCKNCKFVTVEKTLYRHIDTGENVSADELNMAESTYEVCDFLKTVSYVPKWVAVLLKRKIDNDVHYVKFGKDKYLDYGFIELLRKLLHRSRN